MDPVPLVMIHHAGGSANVFAPLQRALPASIQSVALDLPGRGRRWRERPITDARAAVADLAQQISDIGPEVAILGHSLGAYLGLGLAALLERQGKTRCSVLFASANASPGSAELPFDKPALECGDNEIIEIAMLSGGGVPKEVLENKQLRSRTADLLRADFSLSQTFLASNRQTVTEADIAVCCGSEDMFDDLQLRSWENNSTGKTSVRYLPGGHFYLSNEGTAGSLAGIIGARIGTAAGSRV